MSTDELDPYLVLGVAKTASLLEIARARRDLAKAHHPDLARGEAAGDEMRRINAAWDVLADPVARAAWDRVHAAPSAPTSAAQGWTEWAYAPATHTARPETPSGNAGWWVLAAVSLFMVSIMVAGVVATIDRPPPSRTSPVLQENLDR